MKYCMNCSYAIIKYDEKKVYVCWCRKNNKEVGFYYRCEEHK